VVRGRKSPPGGGTEKKKPVHEIKEAPQIHPQDGKRNEEREKEKTSKLLILDENSAPTTYDERKRRRGG